MAIWLVLPVTGNLLHSIVYIVLYVVQCITSTQCDLVLIDLDLVLPHTQCVYKL